MCGIFGIVANNDQPLGEKASAMARALSHRGPDGEGFHISGRAMLGNRRLAIIDVAHGQQPFFSDDKKIIVVQNGEIYNYVELKKELKIAGTLFHTDSDTEVILRLYEKHGKQFVNKLNGMFAIAIYDLRCEEMHIFRDRLGIKPLFYSRQPDGFYFASEIKSLLAAAIKPVARLEAIHHFLSFNYVPPCITMFEGIEHLPAASAITIHANKLESWRWWQPSFATKTQTVDDWAAELKSVLADAVRIHMRSDVEVGAFLSGGVDSSSVVALSASHVKPPMHSFSIGFNEARFDESPYAEAVAKQYQTQHHMRRLGDNTVDLWPKAIHFCEQPHGDFSFVPTYVLSSLAAKTVKVVVTGDGGDELFAGYERYINFIKDYGAATNEQYEQAYFANQGLLSHNEKLALYSPAVALQLSTVQSSSLMEESFRDARELDPVNRMLWLDMNWLLPGNNLVKPDRMGMAVGLEARVPFLDTRVIDLALSMPGDMKLRGGITKFILKEAMKDLLPHDILHRSKQMFTVPVGEWFKAHLAKALQQFLCSNRTLGRGLFNQQAIHTLVNEHTSGAKNHTRILRALVAIEIWYRIYIDGEPYNELADFHIAA